MWVPFAGMAVLTRNLFEAGVFVKVLFRPRIF